jgi:hypothetical protein
VYVGENETVRLVMQFGNKKEDLHPGELEERRGKYMIHCHNLPHEDHDMMSQFSVGLKDYPMDLNDPVRSAPCEDDPELPDL